MRRVAGMLMWIQVAIGYAINSQALSLACVNLFGFSNKSVQKSVGAIGTDAEALSLQRDSRNRRSSDCGAFLFSPSRLAWLCASSFLLLLAFLFAVGVPFFLDMVQLIGALTSVPLALFIPAPLFFRASRLVGY